MSERPIILVLATQGQAPDWLRVLPLGKVELRDGRPGFEADAADLEALVRKFRADGVDLVVDYEHQTLGGEKAPAAGWIKELEVRVDGLYARIEWTQTARQHIEAGEYRYYSPALRVNSETRKVEALLHMGLVNDPAIKNLAPLLAAKYGGIGEPEIFVLAAEGDAQAAQEARAKKYGIGVKAGGHVTKPGEWSQVPDEQFADPVNYRYPMPDRAQCQAAWSYWNQTKNQAQYSPEERAKITNRIKARAQEVGMQISAKEEATAMLKLKAKLGLKPEASEEELLALVDSRAQEAVAFKDMTADLIKELALPAETTPAQLKGAILALKQGQDQLTGLQKDLAALKDAQAKQQAQQAVTEALKAGKLQPTQQEWALAYAARDPEGFKAFIDKAPRLVPVGQELKMVKDGDKGATGLTPDQTTICRQMNIKPEDFKGTQEQMAQAAG